MPRKSSLGLPDPQDLRSAYFPSEAAEAAGANPQTIALVDAYNDPKCRSRPGRLRKRLASLTIHSCSGSESGCFEQVNQNGADALPFPKTEAERKPRKPFA